MYLPSLIRLFFACCLLLVMQTAAHAATVSPQTAKGTAEKWLACRSTLRPTATAKATTKSVRTITASSGKPLFHVVKLEGGGFVVISADDSTTAVIAFSDDEDLVEDNRNPLWIMLNRDLPMRLSLAKSTKTAYASAKTGTVSVDDLRVRPILKSKWDQTTVNGKSVYNYYTPSGVPCGCVATAAAQVIRHHEFPKDSVAKASYPCEVSGRSQTLTTVGGIYDWSKMPLIPDSTISDTECEMIGRLAYDIGVASHMSYTYGGSGTIAYHTEKALKDLFHYRQAVYLEQFNTKTGVMGQLENAVLANLDAGCPVMMGISGKDVATRQNIGHEIVGDGYGYIDGTLYVHLNLGWSGSWDAWYNLPTIDAYSGRVGSNFNLFDDLVYNIFPEDALEVISGRVLGDDGMPIQGATVYAANADNQAIASATTSEFGVYALKVPADGTFSIHTELGSLSGGSRTVTTGKSDTYTPYFKETYAASFDKAVGNRWGCDLTIRAGTCASPTFSQSSCSFVDSLVITCSQPDHEATVRYTTDGSDPTSASAVWPSTGLMLRHTTTVKARASRKGMADSPISEATFTDHPKPTISNGTLAWVPPIGARYYRVYKSSNRFGTELEPCTQWTTATTYQAQASVSAEEPIFYFVRAAARADDTFASPLSDAIALTSPPDSDSGANTQVLAFIDIDGGNNLAFRISDFPTTINAVYYSTAGAFGKNGFFKVNIPTTSRKNISIPENAATGSIKTTIIIPSAKFGEANGTVLMDENSTSNTPRAWRTSLYFVQGSVTNYVGRNTISASPVYFHYFQQCAPNLSIAEDEIAVASSESSGALNVACAREHEWDANSDSPWLTLVRTHGRGPCAVRFTTESNPDDKPRTATITIACGAERKTCVVNQTAHDDADPTPAIPSAIYAIATQGTKASSVLLHWTTVAGANTYKIYRAPAQEEFPTQPYWTSTNPIPALIDFGVQPGFAYRYRIVAIVADGKTEPSQDAIGWAATSVSPGQSTVELVPTNATARVVIMSNAGWEASTDAKWISLDAIDTTRNGVLDISADDNPTALPRTATITLIGGGSTSYPATNTIIVTQSPAVSNSAPKSQESNISSNLLNALDTSADPTVKAIISMRDGSPHVSWTSELPPEEQFKRIYTVWGKESLDVEVKWLPVGQLDEAARHSLRFFRVSATWK